MRNFRHWPIKTKLILLSLLSVAIALALSAAGITVNEVFRMRALKMEELQTQAEMLGFNCTGALSFGDVPAAKQFLGSLRSQPTIEYACLYDSAGKPLAQYPASSTTLPPSVVANDMCRFNETGRIELFHRVFDRDELVGGLYIRANADDLRGQLLAYTKILAVVVFVALVVSISLAVQLQRSISGPILQLAETATRITSFGDYSIRVARRSDDELGVLCMEFNRMLDRVDASDTALKEANEALQAAHDELEQRVLARTAELRNEILQRQKAQADLEHARDVAESASRAKSQFLANMSHEIRTPLNAVLGFTDLLLKGGDDGDPAKRREYLGLIHTSGGHLLGLINDVLDLSKIEAGRMEIERVPCSPQQILADVVSVLRVRANEKGLGLEYRWESGVPEVVAADPQRLRQLLVNLVSNAIKFTSAGGVNVTGRMDCDERRTLLVFDVADTGVGIPKEKLNDIFDPFVQADNSVTRKFGGTGLGLTISRRIVEAMGGALTVQSEVGKGSVFTAAVAVERTEAAPLAGTARADIVTRGARRPMVAHGSVLVVEDGDTNRKLIELVLRRAGVEVTTAENGKLGVEAALAGKFDLILMDMQMPVMDGYTAARTLRERGLRLPIIALTAHAMSGDEQKCRAAGCSGFITKPIHADSLVQSVAEAIDQWRASLGAEGQSSETGVECRTAALEVDVRPAAAMVDNQGATAMSSLQPAASASTSPLAGAMTGSPSAPRGEPICSDLPIDDVDFREIVEEFVDRLHVQLGAMQEALARGDLGELARLAHWLKGAGGSAGFAALTAPAKHLETVVKDKRWDEIESAINELLGLAARIVRPSDLPADTWETSIA